MCYVLTLRRGNTAAAEMGQVDRERKAVSEAAPENKSPESNPGAVPTPQDAASVNWIGTAAPSAIPPGPPPASIAAAPGRPPATARPMRRPSNTVARKASDSQTAKPSMPPTKAKSAAMLVCAALLLACIGMGGYLIYKKTANNTPAAKTEKLSPEAQALADKANAAQKIYEEGRAKASSNTIEDLKLADDKLMEASKLFNEIVDSNQTVASAKKQIELAHDKKLGIDKELLQVREKIYNLDMQKSRDRSRAAQAAKTPDSVPAAPTIGKEPTKEELSDENLNKLFDNDPSEYERIAKFREKIDPNFKMKKP
jgi:hypothetical protein